MLQYIPVSFVRPNGLSNTYCKIVLLNEMGRSWKLSLVHDKSGSYLRQGWRSFCRANGINGGRYTFKLVRNSETPVIRLYQAEHRHEDNTHSYLVGSLTPSSLRNDTLVSTDLTKIVIIGTKVVVRVFFNLMFAVSFKAVCELKWSEGKML